MSTKVWVLWSPRFGYLDYLDVEGQEIGCTPRLADAVAFDDQEAAVSVASAIRRWGFGSWLGQAVELEQAILEDYLRNGKDGDK